MTFEWENDVWIILHFFSDSLMFTESGLKEAEEILREANEL